MLGVASLTVLIKLKSDTCGVVGSLSSSSSPSESTLPSFGLSSSVPTRPSPSLSGPLPGSESGSNWSLAVTSATLSNSTPSSGASTVTSNVTITLPPEGTVSPSHAIADPVAVPPLLMLAIAEYPLGTSSATATFVASLGPSLITSIVNVITSPTLGVASLTVLIKLKSATCGVVGSLSASSSSSGSTLPSLGLSSSEPISPSPSGSIPLPSSLSISA